jgi:hypothetical protein
MKNKIITVGICALLLIFSAAAFAANPDFSGTWTLDKTKSEGLPPGMDQTMTVTQTGDKISIETKLIGDKGEQIVPDAYTLDGKETEFAPRAPNGSIGKGKRTAKWTEKGFEISDFSTFDTPEGEKVTVKMTRKWTLSADGKTLQIEINAESPQGTQIIKRTFIKK